MRYFDDVIFIGAGHQPQARVWMETSWPSFYALQFCASGVLHQARRPNPITVFKGPVVHWTLPDHAYVIGARAPETWEHYWVTMRGDRGERWFRDVIGPLSDRDHLPVRSAEPYRTLFRELVRLVRKRDPADQPERVALVEQILARLAGERPGPLVRPWDATMRAVAAELGACAEVRHDFRATAAKLGVSYHTFRDRFREALGMAPHAYLQRAVLLEASRRLARPGARIKEIASELGFGSPAHFTKQFRLAYGLSPRDYVRGTRWQTWSNPESAPPGPSETGAERT